MAALFRRRPEPERSRDLDLQMDYPPGWLVAGGGPIPEQVAEWIGRRPDLADFRELMVDAATKWSRACEARGALTSAVRYDVTTEEPVTPVFGYLEVTTVAVGGRDLEEVAAEAYPEDGRDEVAAATSTVDTASGRALRSEFVRAGKQGKLRMSVQYVVPIPGTDDALFLAFSHGNLAASAMLVDEYDHIASRVRVNLAA